MAKKLRDIAGKGQQFSGTRGSKVAPPDIDDKNLYQWNAKDGVAFVKKHDTETHDYPYDADAAFKGKKDGGSKTTKYKFQKDGVYEESEEIDEKYMGFQKTKKALAAKGAKDPSALAAWIGRKKYGKAKFQAAAAAGKKLGETHVHNNITEKCNHTMEGVMCEVHGESACPTKEDDVNVQPKAKKDKMGRSYLADKKKCMDEASQYRSTYGMGKRGWASSKAGKVTFQDKAYLPTGPKKAELRAAAEKATTSGAKVTKLPAGKAKGLKEEDIHEVAPPNEKIENWIKSNKARFVKEYGKEKGMQVLYAKAWKMHGQSESGTATNTDYTGPGAAGWTTGRLDVGTL